MDQSIENQQQVENSSSILATVKKIYKNITVEPLVICWMLPFLLTYAAIENMNLEMACRELVTNQTGFSKDVCKLFVRKDEYGINCTEPSAFENTTQFIDVKVYEIRERYPEILASVEDKLPTLFEFLCVAEVKVQQKLSTINSIRNPIASIGPLIIILFAGPWSDKKNLRVPCMLVPYLGEAIGYFTIFIASFFINGPVEFPAYSYRLLPSLSGAETLMFLGVYSYLTATSNDENRTLRFGIFQMTITVEQILAQMISPTIIKRFEYTELFGAMIPIHILGFIYAIFYLKEVKMKKEDDQLKENGAYDNHAMSIELTTINNSENVENVVQESSLVNCKTACLEFFDLNLAIQCIRTFLKKRENHLRSIIVLVMSMHFIMSGLSLGEAQNLFYYLRAKLGWDVDYYVYHNVFTNVAGLLGTAFAVSLLSKILKVADIFLVLISTVLSIVCRVIYVIATKWYIFVFGTAVDFMGSIKLLGVRSILSKIVPAEDLSTMFAIMGLFEALSGFFFPYLYPTFYAYLLDHPNRDISEIFMLSGILFTIALFVYLIVWKLLKRKEEIEAEEEKKDTKL